MGGCCGTLGAAHVDPAGAASGMLLSEHYGCVAEWVGAVPAGQSGAAFIALQEGAIEGLRGGDGEALVNQLRSGGIDGDGYDSVVAHSDALWEAGCVVVSDFWMHRVKDVKPEPRGPKPLPKSLPEDHGKAPSQGGQAKQSAAEAIAARVLSGGKLLPAAVATQRLAVLPVPDGTDRFWRRIGEAPDTALGDARMFRVLVRGRRIAGVSQLTCTNYDPTYATLAHGLLARLPAAAAPQTLPSDFALDLLVTPTRLVVYAMNLLSLRMTLFRPQDGLPAACEVRVRELLRGACLAVGDLHGQLGKLTSLMERLEAALGEEALAQTHLVFLGDLVDRGPDARGVIDFLIRLEQSRPPGKTHFVHGNHDFAFAGFTDLLPIPQGEDFTTHYVGYTGFKLWERTRWSTKHTPPGCVAEMRTGESVLRAMPLQARRYAPPGNDNFSTKPTFNSYNASYGNRDALIAALPEAHRDFFASLQLLVEHEAYVFVHAGLEQLPFGPWAHLSPAAQLPLLRTYDIARPWNEHLSNRHWRDAPALPGRKVVSGHVTQLEAKLGEHHLQIDTCGGHDAGFLTAVLLPEETLYTGEDGGGA